jgi:hypothetical protein
MALFLFVGVISLWLAIWRAVGPGVIFVTACVPFGLLVYGSACAGARHGHPILVGTLTGVAFGIIGTTVVYGPLEDRPLVLLDFTHLTTTGLAVGAACGLVARINTRRAIANRR